MGDKEPKKAMQYRKFGTIPELVEFAWQDYRELLFGFAAPVEVADSYEDVRAYWCQTRGVDDGDIAVWLSGRGGIPKEFTFCQDGDTLHGYTLLLIDELDDPQAFWDSLPSRDKRLGVQMPPVGYVRDLLIDQGVTGE